MSASHLKQEDEVTLDELLARELENEEQEAREAGVLFSYEDEGDVFPSPPGVGCRGTVTRRNCGFRKGDF